MDFKIGDKVTRNSYNNDIIFTAPSKDAFAINKTINPIISNDDKKEDDSNKNEEADIIPNFLEGKSF